MSQAKVGNDAHWRITGAHWVFGSHCFILSPVLDRAARGLRYPDRVLFIYHFRFRQQTVTDEEVDSVDRTKWPGRRARTGDGLTLSDWNWNLQWYGNGEPERQDGEAALLWSRTKAG